MAACLSTVQPKQTHHELLAVDLHFLREARAAISEASTDWVSDRLEPAAVLDWLDTAGDTPSLLVLVHAAMGDVGNFPLPLFPWRADTPPVSNLRRLRDLELSYMDAADLTVVVSPVEVDVIHHFRPALQPVVLSNMYHVPDSMELRGPPCHHRNGVLFVGKRLNIGVV